MQDLLIGLIILIILSLSIRRLIKVKQSVAHCAGCSTTGARECHCEEDTL